MLALEEKLQHMLDQRVTLKQYDKGRFGSVTSTCTTYY
jgi:hypothetical protein